MKGSRVRKTSDLDLVRSLNDRLVGEPIPPRQLREGHWWLSTYHGFLSGYSGLLTYKDDGFGYLVRCGVLPEWRGRGIQRDHIRSRIRYARRYQPYIKRLISYTIEGNYASANNLADLGFRLYDPDLRWSEDPQALYWMKEL